MSGERESERREREREREKLRRKIKTRDKKRKVKGGQEKVVEAKRKALVRDAESCKKISEMFSSSRAAAAGVV